MKTYNHCNADSMTENELRSEEARLEKALNAGELTNREAIRLAEIRAAIRNISRQRSWTARP